MSAKFNGGNEVRDVSLGDSFHRKPELVLLA